MKKIVALCVVLAMLVLLASCTTQDTTGTTSTTTGATTAPTTTAATTTQATTEAVRETYPFTIMHYATPKAEMTVGGQTYYAFLEEKFNVVIDWHTPAQSAYAEALQLMFASEEYPEIAYIPDPKNATFIEAAENGVVLGLNDILATHGANFMEYTYDYSWPSLKVLGDDTIYAVPLTTISRTDGFAIRNDWLENVGIDYEEGSVLTLDEFYEIARAFTFDDPDGNGKDDTYGLGLMSTGGEAVVTQVLEIPFDINGWRQFDEGIMHLKYSQQVDNYKRMLTYVSKLWADGLIHPDWLSIDGSSIMREKLYQGQFGIFNSFPGHLANWDTAGQAVDPNFNVVYMPALKEDANDTTYYSGAHATGIYGCWALMNSNEHPERVLEVFDYMLDDDFWFETVYGLEGVMWNKVGDEYVPTDAPTTGRNNLLVRRKDDPGIWLALALNTETRNRLAGQINIAIELFVPTLDKGFKPPVAQDPTLLDYEKFMVTETTRIIFGEKSVDYWDELLSGWYAAGGETYIQQMREFIANNP